VVVEQILYSYDFGTYVDECSLSTRGVEKRQRLKCHLMRNVHIFRNGKQPDRSKEEGKKCRAIGSKRD
jgi:hypothetical protein